MQILDRVRWHAQSTPERAAIVHRDRETTYGELARRVEDAAAQLLASGVAPTDRVVLWMETGEELLAALLACWWVGAVPVLADTRRDLESREHVRQRVDARVIMISAAASNGLATSGDECVLDALDGRSAHRVATLGTDPSSVLFTSGSTGMPKGVVQSHGNSSRGALSVAGRLGLTSSDRVLCAVPWTFDYGFVNLQMVLSLGCTLIVPDTQGSPFGLAEDIVRTRPTVLAGVPAVLPYVIDALAKTDSIRAVTNTGGRIESRVYDRLLGALPHAEIHLAYGLTESYRTTCLPPSLARSRPACVGRAIPGVQLAIVDADGRPVGPGIEGEIVHRGDFLFLGYWGQPEATASRLRRDPCLPSGAPRVEALFTGDRGVMDEDGWLEFRGRLDRQLKTLGTRVSPDEVERLVHQSGLVDEVAVIGQAHPTLGHEVCALVVLSDGSDLGALRAYLQTVAAHLRPRQLRTTERLPRTHSSKIDYPRIEQEWDQHALS